jgi:L-ribulose-5-phosphate 4-epimerase
MEEGYVKFNCNWIPSNNIPTDKVAALNIWRDIMYSRGLIGIYLNGIGFGNISMRCDGNTFLISGTATGGISTLNGSHYSLVTQYDLTSNSVTCVGPTKASSESLTHALIYECSPGTNAVIHVHSLDLWTRLLHHVPTTGEDISYGTPAMANEVKRLFDETEVGREKIIVMAGHREGIISFGRDLEEAAGILIGKL